MSTNIPGNDQFDANVTIPDNGESSWGSIANGAYQSLANRTVYNKNDISDLSSVVAGITADYVTSGDIADFITDTEVAAVSAGLDSRISVIEGDYLTSSDLTPYITSTEVSSISSGLDSRITDLETATVPAELIFAVSNETNNLEAATNVITFRMPHAMTLTSVRASVATAPVGSTIIVDVNKNGSSILSTKLTIDENEETSTTAAIPPVISDSSLADDDKITVDIDQIGSSTPGKALKIVLKGTRA